MIIYSFSKDHFLPGGNELGEKSNYEGKIKPHFKCESSDQAWERNNSVLH
jgi:hypothetical protein